MAGRVAGKAALIMGAGQTPGETVGNGRAVGLVLAREGATVVIADRDLSAAEETVALIKAEGFAASALQCDVTSEEDVAGAVEVALQRLGRLDILHNNVGASIALGDAPAIDLTEAAFDRSFAVNLKGMWLACKHAMPALRESSGSIVNISSLAAVGNYPLLGYKTMKAAVISLTENLAMANAEYGVRVNCILPGLMNTPMAIENRVAQGTPRADVIASRDRRVPLRRKMGSGWDVAYASLFLHSDEAQFVTGISMRVDGGQSLDVPA
jgi:NAD(P)-dependent dehydrogenase (short-subunit alcohol dehydrogenase family)